MEITGTQAKSSKTTQFKDFYKAPSPLVGLRFDLLQLPSELRDHFRVLKTRRKRRRGATAVGHRRGAPLPCGGHDARQLRGDPGRVPVHRGHHELRL